ncbi:hypothetical protein [Acaryochloris marina]|uniref:hypothetical protein n=1 Tax=Acaryochloris marina TaxID=155978 RepID=UPI001BAF49E6|nr:hypothetical protein [Acaryochloris marina]QUY41970.1 hypothetical protein I1H34_22575 [Acaryochloris marina S15]
MVQLLPRDRFIIQTPDALQAVIARLDTQLEPPKTLRRSFGRNHAPYEGSVSESGFTMHRIPVGRDSFIPRIEGYFETPLGGTSVHITMKLHFFDMSFLVVWPLFWYSASLSMWISGSITDTVALLSLGMPLFMLGLFWISFWLEVERSHNDLLEMIVGQVPKSRQHQHQKLFFLQGVAFVIIFSFLSISTHISEPPPAKEVPESFRSQ